MNTLGKIIFLGILIAGVPQILLAADAQDAKAAAKSSKNQNVIDAFKKELKEKTKLTGSLDLYDSKINKVRNLKMIQIKDDVQKDGAGYIVPGEYRDMKSAEIVTVEASLEEKNGELVSRDFNITGITTEVKNNVVKPNIDAKKEYSDKDIQDVMQDYFKQQTQFSDHLQLFDEAKNKMRNLDLIKLSEQVRRLGILYISTADFKDSDAGDTLAIDVTVQNKDGILDVQSLRIRSVKKATEGEASTDKK